MEKYTEVPNIITGKDLDYLSDMFEWNIGVLKNTNASIPKVQDEEITNILKKGCQLFDENLHTILNLLGGYNGEEN